VSSTPAPEVSAGQQELRYCGQQAVRMAARHEGAGVTASDPRLHTFAARKEWQWNGA